MHNKDTILIVDDQELIRDLLEEAPATMEELIEAAKRMTVDEDGDRLVIVPQAKPDGRTLEYLVAP